MTTVKPDYQAALAIIRAKARNTIWLMFGAVMVIILMERILTHLILRALA